MAVEWINLNLECYKGQSRRSDTSSLEKRLQVTLELKVQDFIGQNKADAAILELQYKEELRLWKHGLEQKIQEIIKQHEQQKEEFKTWQCGLEETLELKTQEIIEQNKRQKEENEGGRQELKKC